MAAFCDWLDYEVPLSGDHTVYGGQTMKLDQHGAVEWVKAHGLALRGSHDASMYVHSGTGYLRISGNPTKWLQGHNVFGSGDVRQLAVRAADDVCKRLELEPTSEDRGRWYDGEVKLHRVDATRQYRLPAGTVRRFVQFVGTVAHSRYQARSLEEGGTAYVGKRSRRISMKFYDKREELKKHPLALTLDADRERLLAYADDVLRIEVTARSMFLKDVGKARVCDWDAEGLSSLVDDRLARLSILDNVMMTEDEKEQLPPRLLGVYHAWKAGEDLSAKYSKSAFYRHRSQLLAYGVDIAQVRPQLVAPAERQYPLGAPLRSFISGPGLEPPTWSYGTPLLACS